MRTDSIATLLGGFLPLLNALRSDLGGVLGLEPGLPPIRGIGAVGNNLGFCLSVEVIQPGLNFNEMLDMLRCFHTGCKVAQLT